MVNHLFLTRSSTTNAQQRPLLVRQNRLRSSPSDSTSVSNVKGHTFDVFKSQRNHFDFDPITCLKSYAIPESTISSIRPASDSSSANPLRRSLSQSDLATSCEDPDTPRAKSVSLSDIHNTHVTLLELSKAAQLKNVSRSSISLNDLTILICR